MDRAEALRALGVVTVIGAGADARPAPGSPVQPSDGAIEAKILDLTAAGLREAIHDEGARRAAGLLQHYADHEQQTFEQQRREAVEWYADHTVQTPMLSRIAARRGLSLDELVSRVLAKASAFAIAAGDLVGAQNAIEDRVVAIVATFAAGTVDAATALADLAAIDPADPRAWSD